MVSKSKNKMETKIHEWFGGSGATILFSHWIWCISTSSHVCWRSPLVNQLKHSFVHIFYIDKSNKRPLLVYRKSNQDNANTIKFPLILGFLIQTGAACQFLLMRSNFRPFLFHLLQTEYRSIHLNIFRRHIIWCPFHTLVTLAIIILSYLPH